MPTSSEREAFWRNLIARRDTLQLTDDEACEQAGVSPASFYHWRQKFRLLDRRPAQDAARSTALVSVRIVNDRVAMLTLELPHGLRPAAAASSRLRRGDARAHLASGAGDLWGAGVVLSLSPNLRVFTDDLRRLTAIPSADKSALHELLPDRWAKSG